MVYSEEEGGTEDKGEEEGGAEDKGQDIPENVREALAAAFGVEARQQLGLPPKTDKSEASPEAEAAMRRLQGSAWLRSQSPSWGRPNRRGIAGLRGKATGYNAPEVRLYVDVSGSMVEYIPKALAWAEDQAVKGGGSVNIYTWSDTVPTQPTLDTRSGGTNWGELREALDASRSSHVKCVVLTDMCGASSRDVLNADLILTPPSEVGVTWEGFR